MNELVVYCPSCKTDIRLTESIAAPLLDRTRKQFESKLAAKDAEVSKQQTELQKQKLELAKAKASVDEQITMSLAAERGRIAAEELKKARLAVAGSLEAKAKEVTELNKILRQQDLKLAEAQDAQAELIRRTRELENAKREMALTVEKRVNEALNDLRDQARTEAEETFRLKVLEKEMLINSMQQKIEELKRKAEQGSQQLQGEVQELNLEASLRAAFPMDRFYPVSKGESGGDIIHQVIGPSGSVAGTIVWECKRTKSWSDSWLGKLREDQRKAKADIAIVVSQAMPKHVQILDVIDGVWVAPVRCAVPVAIALRHGLIETSLVRMATAGQHGKMERMYDYLTGPQFRRQVQAIVEQFTDMSTDLEKERRNTTRMWAKREQQIRRVVDCTASLYGELQGIAGQSLQEIEGLSMLLPEPDIAP